MKVWLVNTNSKEESENPNGFKFMLRQNKASAYYDKKVAIDKISTADIVLLYHNNNRVIAVGCVIENVEYDFPEIHNTEHWVDVNWIWKANFNDKFEPTNAIDRNKIGITMVNNTVVNITNQLDYKVLFEQIAQKQNYL
jgi:predicted Mrr-cat superfamily restriction endonuclease